MTAKGETLGATAIQDDVYIRGLAEGFRQLGPAVFEDLDLLDFLGFIDRTGTSVAEVDGAFCSALFPQTETEACDE